MWGIFAGVGFIGVFIVIMVVLVFFLQNNLHELVGLVDISRESQGSFDAKWLQKVTLFLNSLFCEPRTWIVGEMRIEDCLTDLLSEGSVAYAFAPDGIPISLVVLKRENDMLRVTHLIGKTCQDVSVTIDNMYTLICLVFLHLRQPIVLTFDDPVMQSAFIQKGLIEHTKGCIYLPKEFGTSEAQTSELFA